MGEEQPEVAAIGRAAFAGERRFSLADRVDAVVHAIDAHTRRPSSSVARDSGTEVPNGGTLGSWIADLGHGLEEIFLLALVLRPVPAEVAARIRTYADALGIDDAMLEVAAGLAAGHSDLVAIDFDRNGYAGADDPARIAALHTRRTRPDPWAPETDDGENRSMSNGPGWLRLHGASKDELIGQLDVRERSNGMKYITIIYGNKDLWQSFTPDQATKAIADVDAFNRRHKESGELLGAYGLGDELTAKTVRVRDGVPAVTDGPYVEAKEFVSSFFLLDVDSEERALSIAAEYPFAAHNAVEVWPILHESGPEL